MAKRKRRVRKKISVSRRVDITRRMRHRSTKKSDLKKAFTSAKRRRLNKLSYPKEQLTIGTKAVSVQAYHEDGLRRYQEEVCRARKEKRQVLFATRKTGKGSSAKKRFSINSKVRC